MAASFDTLRAAKRLKGLGFNEEQAEGLAEMLREIAEPKADIVDRRDDPERAHRGQPVPAVVTRRP